MSFVRYCCSVWDQWLCVTLRNVPLQQLRPVSRAAVLLSMFYAVLGDKGHPLLLSVSV